MFEIAINAFESALIILFTGALLETKRSYFSKFLLYTFFSLTYFLYISYINLFSVSESFLTFINYFIVFVFTYMVSCDKLAYKLFVSTLALNIIGIENCVQNMTISYVLFGRIDYYLLMDEYRAINVIVSQLIHMILFYLCYIVSPKLKKYITDRDFYIVTVLSMLCNYISISFEAVAIKSAHYEFLSLLGIYETVVFVVIMVLLFKSVYLHSQNEAKQRLNVEIYKSQIETNDKVLCAKKELYQLRHDMKHFIQVIKEVESSDNRINLQKTIEQYDNAISAGPVPIQTSSPAVNYVLNIKREEAISKGMSFVSKINIPHPITMDESDIYLLLANLLDNAIIHNGMDHNIYLEMNDVGEMFMIRVSNSVDIQLLNNGHEFIKTHKEEEHGYGVKTIEQVAEKYGGFISYAQTKNQLVATVLLPLRIIAQDK